MAAQECVEHLLLAALDGDGREVAIGLGAAVVINASAQLWLALA